MACRASRCFAVSAFFAPGLAPLVPGLARFGAACWILFTTGETLGAALV